MEHQLLVFTWDLNVPRSDSLSLLKIKVGNVKSAVFIMFQNQY
jgi:hypothetical protein